MQFVLEVVVAADAEVIADATAVGGDGLVMGDAVEQEEVSQTVEVSVGEADGLLVGQPFIDVLMLLFLGYSCQIIIMFTFGHHLDCISASFCFLLQGISINIEPIEGLSDGVLVLHPEAMLSVIPHVIW